MRVLPGKDNQAGAAEGNIYMHIFHSIYVDRSLPYFSKPGKMLL